MDLVNDKTRQMCRCSDAGVQMPKNGTDGPSESVELIKDDNFRGTAVVYNVLADGHDAFQCDYELETYAESFPEQVRAYREERKKAGKPLPRQRPDQLTDEILIIFGSEVSANDAAARLERIAGRIRDVGLLVGRNHAGDFVTERIRKLRRAATA